MMLRFPEKPVGTRSGYISRHGTFPGTGQAETWQPVLHSYEANASIPYKAMHLKECSKGRTTTSNDLIEDWLWFVQEAVVHLVRSTRTR